MWLTKCTRVHIRALRTLVPYATTTTRLTGTHAHTRLSTQASIFMDDTMMYGAHCEPVSLLHFPVRHCASYGTGEQPWPLVSHNSR